MSERTEGPGETAAQRRKRLADVFGDTMPAVTSDERDPDAGSPEREEAGERWLREQVPPHHG